MTMNKTTNLLNPLLYSLESTPHLLHTKYFCQKYPIYNPCVNIDYFHVESALCVTTQVYTCKELGEILPHNREAIGYCKHAHHILFLRSVILSSLAHNVFVVSCH